jgi:hypothetical protein
MRPESIIPMQDGGPHWPILVMLAMLALVVVGIVLLIRYFTRPVDVSTLGVARLAESDDTTFEHSPPDAERDTFVVIPDISGYTRFMQLTRFAAGHAQVIVAQLLDAIMIAARPPLLPTRVEGDSVMLHAVSEKADPAMGASGPRVAAAIHDMVTAFYRKRAQLLAGNLCPCEACKHMDELELKVVVHRGQIVRYRLRGLEDLSGMAVIEAHRLLKNSLERNRYVLVSEAASADVRLPWERAPAQHRESYDGIGEVRCDLYLLDEEPGAPDEVPKSPLRDLAAKLAGNVQTVTGGAR